MPFADSSFDFVYSIGVLHHLPDPPLAFREVYRVLSPGGRALIAVYQRHSLKAYASHLIRFGSRILDLLSGKRHLLLQRLTRGPKRNNPWGTELVEVLGCPIIYRYSRRQLRRICQPFSKVRLDTAPAGLSQLATLIPPPVRPLTKKLLVKLENFLKPFGFMWVVILEK